MSAHEGQGGLPLSGPHWDFALATYTRPGVAEACLLLQDRHGIDVNVALIALYAACGSGRMLAPDEIAGADARVAPWREAVVVPLRAIRRRMKEGPAPAPSPESEGVRKTIKAAELQAERLQQAVLADWLASLGPSPATPDPEAILARVVLFYGGEGAPKAAREEIARIAAAAVLARKS